MKREDIEKANDLIRVEKEIEMDLKCLEHLKKELSVDVSYTYYRIRMPVVTLLPALEQYEVNLKNRLDAILEQLEEL